MGHRGHADFVQKVLNTQHSVARCSLKSTIMKWSNMLKEYSKKNSLKLNAASQNTSGNTDTDGFLEHSSSRGSLYYKGPSLQKISPLKGSPLYMELQKSSNSNSDLEKKENRRDHTTQYQTILQGHSNLNSMVLA